jgi:putative transposase
MKALRNQCINGGQREGATATGQLPTWVTDVPYDVRDEAMRDLLKAFKTCFAKGDKFKMRFRSRKASQDTITVLAKHWGRTRGAYAALFRPGVLNSSEALPTTLPSDSRLTRSRLGHYHLCIPQELPMHGAVTACSASGSDNQAPAPTVRVASIDPGVRTFATVYSSEGEVTQWGSGDVGRIYRLCAHMDKLQSKWSAPGVRHAQRRRMRRAGLRMQLRIRNLVRELHHKLALYLCRTHDIILLPKFDTQNMVRRGKRVIKSKTARAMCTWSHYRFRQHLVHKAQAFPGRQVVLVSEAYTSKTCGRCGWMHPNLGGSKVFLCGKCGLRADRDVNGARNVMLRTVGVGAGAGFQPVTGA